MNRRRDRRALCNQRVAKGVNTVDHSWRSAIRRGTTAVGIIAGALGAAVPFAAAAPVNGPIAFVSNRGGTATHIWTMQPDGTGQAPLTSGPTNDVDPAYSPDGTQIAFSRQVTSTNFDLYVVNADGTGLKQVTTSTRSERYPAWSPDGKRLAFRQNTTVADSFNIETINLDGTGQLDLTKGRAALDGEPSYSPDGTRIAFASSPQGATGDAGYDIYVMNVDGSNIRQLTPDPTNPQSPPQTADRFPSWSPDGRLIAFISDRAGDYTVYTMTPDGLNQSPLSATRTSGDRYPAWSPDGTKLAFRRLGTGADRANRDIYTVNIDGSGLARLTTDPSIDISPTWGASPANGALPGPDLALTAGAAPQPATVGRDLTYTYTVSNHGVGNATAATLTVTLPTGVTLAALPAGCTGGTPIVCLLGPIAHGTSVSRSFVVGVPAPGTLTSSATVTATPGDAHLGDNSATLTFMAVAIPAGSACTVMGTEGNDTIVGTPGNDVICALGGDDRIDAGTGNDTIDAGSGNDRVLSGAGQDRVLGGPGNDVVYGGLGSDRIDAGIGADTVLAGPDNDVIAGNLGNDRLYGGLGADRLSGGRGADLLAGGRGVDVLLGSRGNDTLIGGLGRDLMYGGAERDRFLSVDRYRDRVYGGTGRDRATADRRDILRGVEIATRR
jgi:uncharacterized repeat protein (TIGR01451 family)